jgi:hypothetical protein
MKRRFVHPVNLNLSLLKDVICVLNVDSVVVYQVKTYNGFPFIVNN